MYTYNGGYPLVASQVVDGVKVPFKCRIVGDDGQFFTINSAGLEDTGVRITIASPKRIKKEGRIILDGIVYSISGVRAHIPDRTVGGSIRRKINAEYIIDLV